jgi:two-component system, chemotaxis family, sensor kinase CheA
MSIENDETLQIYLEESLEHLADIESDLLEIERAGADINEDLVNKVYRAAHSIKGGAGFMGLSVIKDLTHEMENILGKIRSRELIPNPEIVNILLMASDALKALIADVFNSNDADISQHITALKAIIDGPAIENYPDQAPPSPAQDEEPWDVESEYEVEKQADGMKIAIPCPDGKTILHAQEEELFSLREDGKHVYLIQTELIRDYHSKGKTPLSLMEEMQSCGIILDCNFDMGAIGTISQGSYSGRIPFMALYASILKPNDINKLFEIDERNIFTLTEEMTVMPISGETPSENLHPEKIRQDEPASKSASPDDENSSVKDSRLNQTEAGSDRGAKKIQSSAKDPSAPSATTTSAKKGAQEAAPGSSTPETSLRVSISLLDSLMNLAGELVLSRNQLLQSISSTDHRSMEIAGQRVDLITSELQETIMLTRMQAIGNVFNKFPRVVRDLARKLGKEVELTLEGNDVEMDKTIIEAINDPLTHLVRNAVDHGIESPDVRRAAGKDPTGHVKLKAFHEAGQVNIAITDDGKGLDGKKIASTAVAKGLITEEQAATMSEKERANLIFLPGFSTAEKVTDVSGRGVGMDVVKTNLDKLGGVVDIESQSNKGMAIRIKLPLTLAIIPSQIIVTGTERYAIPQVNLEELLRIPAAQVKERIERVGNAEVVRLRGNLLPLVKLADVIGLEKLFRNPETRDLDSDRRGNIADRRCKKSPAMIDGEETMESTEADDDIQAEIKNKRTGAKDRRYHASSALNIVVVSTGAMKYGLVVDELHDSEEIVVKPLGRHLKYCKGYAGATIMGDGKVALILDVGNLAKMASLTSMGGTDRANEVTKENETVNRMNKDKQSLLIFRNAVEDQFVVPLNQVERIEKIKKSQVEEVGGKKVLQYRGGSLPLFSIDQVANVKPLADSEEILIIVFNIAGKSVGLMAMGPVDVVELFVEFDESTVRQPGILGSAVINRQTTLLVDVYGIVQTLNPEWFANKEEKISLPRGETFSVLVVEDSNFFRNQVKGYMHESGYHVIEAEDGVDAWNQLQKNASQVSLVCTDIEMPNLDGFGLTEKIRQDCRFDHLPVIALTTLAADEDVARGKSVGIDEYHIKLDKEALMESVHHFLMHGRNV